MDEINNNTSNFSDVPSLDDTAGLNTYLENEQMTAQGIQPEVTAPGVGTNDMAQQPAIQVQPTQPVTQPNLTQGADTNNLTKDQLGQIMSSIESINQRLNAQQAQPQVQTPQTYTEQERAFINAALAKGYPLDQINATIMNRRNNNVNNVALEQRMANLENTLRSQEYKQAEAAFIGKLTDFGTKFGLSEQDLVTFGNTALTKGINIAMPNVDLETVFRAVYPEQYRIRMQRMTPTNASQIYGGTSVPEGNRAAAARMEDAYVDQFLKKAMPNYGNKQ